MEYNQYVQPLGGTMQFVRELPERTHGADHSLIREECMKNPGEWTVFRSYPLNKAENAYVTTTRINKGGVASLAGLRAATRKQDDRVNVWVTYPTEGA
jgi:hypothetical protein